MLHMFFVFVTILNYFLITEVRYILKSLSLLTTHTDLKLFGMLCIYVCVCVYLYINISNFLFNCMSTGPEVS